MPMGILKFKLPEETEDFEMAQKAWKYKLVLDDLMEYLRRLAKYEDQETVSIEELKEQYRLLIDQYEL